MNAGEPPFSIAYPELAKYWQDKPEVPANPIKRNLIVNCGKFTNGKPEWGPFKNNWVTTTDPGFVGASRGNYRLTPDAMAFKEIPGFKPIPFDEIGIQK